MSVDRTTIAVRQRTHRRLSKLKPYETMSFDEFARELADVYEERNEA